MDFLLSQLCRLESWVLYVCLGRFNDKHSWIMLKQADLTIQRTMRNPCRDFQQADPTFWHQRQIQIPVLFSRFLMWVLDTDADNTPAKRLF